jgi:hypothetical protein
MMMPSRWPIAPFMYTMRSLPATPAQKRFATHVVQAQLKSFRTGKFDPVAMAQGRLGAFGMLDDYRYYRFVEDHVIGVRELKLVNTSTVLSNSENSGVWTTVTLTTDGRREHVPFYANPTYKSWSSPENVNMHPID